MATSNAADPALQNLRNRFFIIRHGQSLSNVQQILVTNPDIGCHEYGLTDKGKQQALEAAHNLRDMLSDVPNLKDKIVMYSSDFLRVKQTAETIHRELGIVEPLKLEEALRERRLGKWDMCPGKVVEEMWSRDAIDPTHKYNDVESVMEMVLRMSRLVKQLDARFEDRIIVLCSHGDPCQILHTVFIGIPPNEFRNQPDYKNCEIRELIFK